MASVPAVGSASFVRCVSGGRRSIVKLGVSPSTGIGKSLAVFFHKEKVCQDVRHVYDKLGFGAFLRFPLNLCDLGTLWKGFAVSRNAGLESGNYRGIAQDRFHSIIGLRDGEDRKSTRLNSSHPSISY